MGHGHDAHDGMKIPKPEIYNVEKYPELMKIQERLAKQGLKDPWLRNHSWRYNPKYPSMLVRAGTFVFRGWKTGVAAFLLTIAAEKALGITYDHGHHEDHSSDEHH